MNKDQQAIAAQQLEVRSLQLWRLLQSLRSTTGFMHTGAHPDDERSAMLAALSLRDGVSVSYACANRGEGGQNDLGTETTVSLGIIRTAEMEKAADILQMRLYWLSEADTDSIFDFGLSKSGDETLSTWGHERTLQRFVEIVRQEKPDILCPTFLDIPGQHGHHRAMTRLAFEVFDAAADSSFSCREKETWQVAQLFLPAWSGAGGAYDDEEPPPPVTHEVSVEGNELPSGWSWAEIGEHSRAFHRTQGMGKQVDANTPQHWPLHLARTTNKDKATEKSVQALLTGVPQSLGELAGCIDSEQMGELLSKAHEHCMQAINAWPAYSEIADNAVLAIKTLNHLQQILEDSSTDSSGNLANLVINTNTLGYSPSGQSNLQHRIARKQVQLGHILRLAVGVKVQTRLSSSETRPGQALEYSFDCRTDSTDTNVSATLSGDSRWQIDGSEIQYNNQNPDNQNQTKAANPSYYPDGYRSFYDPLVADSPALQLQICHTGISANCSLALNAPMVLPEYALSFEPQKTVINTTLGNRSIEIAISSVYPRGSAIEAKLQRDTGLATALNTKQELDQPGSETWSFKHSGDSCRLQAPDTIATGLYNFTLTIADKPAYITDHLHYPHINPRLYCREAKVSVMSAAIHLPESKIAYIGGGNDRVDHWLRTAGVPIDTVSEADLSASTLENYDSLLLGVFVFKQHPSLVAKMPLIHQWIKAGGNLVTLYHRPWDNWDPASIPPEPLEIGQPSLRWRVTDENAKVTCLDENHPLLNYPNKINSDDWANWHKERGLYFAKSWDPAFTPLLSMNDPGEEPLLGALLSAEIENGRYTHCALNLHHQLNQQVPGAYRLMVNLVAGITKP